MRESSSAAGARSRGFDFRYVLNRALQVIFWAFMIAVAILHSERLTPLSHVVLSDFANPYSAGRMALEGHYVDAYDMDVFTQKQMTSKEDDGFFLWFFPPPVGLLAALLSMLPYGAAYALFIVSTYLFFMAALRRLSSSDDVFLFSRLLAAPAILYNIACGQNGFLVGGLIGFFCLYSLAGRPAGGAFLGALAVFKPHLVAGLGALALVERRYGSLAMAAAVVVLSSILATLCFGTAVWPAFLKTSETARAFLAEGRIKFQGMVTVYASLRLLGADATIAGLGQLVSAAAALCMIFYGVFKGWEPRRVFGLAVLSSLCVSPYAFVYDFTGVGLAAALLAEPLDRACGSLKKLLLFALIWAATGGLLFNMLFIHAAAPGWVTFSGLLFLSATALIFFTLQSAHAKAAAS